MKTPSQVHPKIILTIWDGVKMVNALGSAASTTKIDGNTSVSKAARVEGHAEVIASTLADQAKVSDSSKVMNTILHKKSRVYGSAKVSSSFLYDNAQVYGKAKLDVVSVRDNAKVYGHSRLLGGDVGGKSQVYGSVQTKWLEAGDTARIYENAKINSVIVRGRSHVFGNANLDNDKKNNLVIILEGNCKFGGSATFVGLNTSEDFVSKYGKNKVKVKGGEIILTDIWDMG